MKFHDALNVTCRNVNRSEKKHFFGKRAAAVGLTLAMSALLMAGCGSAAASGSNKSGSSSSSKTEKTTDISGNVSTNGSTSMESVIGALSESFMQDNPNVNVTYDATGSGSGIEAASTGTTDIGLASRDLTDDEKAKGLEQKTIALDGIAIIVNADSKLTNLTLDQIASIYKGEVTNWSEVGGEANEIAAIGREAGSGTRDGFETITNTKDQCKLSQELTSTGAVIEAVKNSPNAIGYASFSSVEGQNGIKILTVDGVKCSEKTIKSGEYKVQRDFNLITMKGKELSPAAKAFYDYATSKDAYKLIEKAGVVPVSK